MIFGLLITAETWGALATGWVYRAVVEPQYTFTFMGFEWLQFLIGEGMYLYYGVMGAMGILVMLGWRYRLSLSLFTLMWWGSYLLQKSSYNNHYYLLILFCLVMLVLPAHANGSKDAIRVPSLASNYCPQWCIWIIPLLLWVVYTYAAIAKLYPGWMEGHFISAAFSNKAHYPIIGSLLQEDWLQKMVIWGGFLFDLTVIPLLWIKQTRKLAVGMSLVFHLFNSVVFGIGIFPYLMLGCILFFYQLQKWDHKFLTQYDKPPPNFNLSPWLAYALALFFLLQIGLPLRHHFIKGDVLVTEEGHRMSWRMMLRTKSGYVRFMVKDLANDAELWVNPNEYLTQKQSHRLATHPDMIWQFSRYLRQQLQTKGLSEIEIYAHGTVSINGGARQTLIDPTVDLLSVDWNHFSHNHWILHDLETTESLD